MTRNATISPYFFNGPLGFAFLSNQTDMPLATEDIPDLPTVCNDMDPYPQSQVLFRLYLTAPVALMGLVTNSINIWVFSRKFMLVSPTNWFLLALAFSDATLLLSTLLMLSYPIVAERIATLQAVYAANVLTRWFYPLANLSQAASVYLLVGMTIHRYLGICHPFLAQTILTKKNIRFGIGGILAFAAAFSSMRWVYITTQDCYSVKFNQSSIHVWVIEALARSAGYTIVYECVLYLLVMFLVPFASLCYLNTRLIAALRRSYSLRKKSQPDLNRAQSRGNFQYWQLMSNLHTELVFSDPERPRPPRRGGPPRGRSELTLAIPQSNGHSNLNSARSERSSPKSTRSLNGYPSNLRSPAPRFGVRKEKGVTGMVVTIVCQFFLCNSLPLLNNLFDAVQKHYFHYNVPDKIRAFFTVSVELGNFLVVINASICVVIYFVFNRKYRAVLLSLCATQNDPSESYAFSSAPRAYTSTATELQSTTYRDFRSVD